GADAIQLFESWSGLLRDDPDLYERFVIQPTRNIVKRIRAWNTTIPIIGFPRLAGQDLLLRYAEIEGLNGLGLDTEVDMVWAAQHIKPSLTLQGNLDPEILLAGGDRL